MSGAANAALRTVIGTGNGDKKLRAATVWRRAILR